MSISYIGSKLWVKAQLPASFTATGYNALTFVEVKGIVDVGEVGDQQNDIVIDTLVGRVEHVNGSSDLGEIPVSYNFISADAGQVIIRAGAGTNTAHSFKVQDADGKVAYFHGVIANVRDRARSSSEYKGETFTIRGNSAVVRAAAAT
jgi:hypothetical protein